jgi:transcriptional regulator, propionate catabolism operon regulatory protein
MDPRFCFLGVDAVIASPAMRQTMELVERIARTSAAVMIIGETGSGKEIVARALHHYSPRSARPWVDVNCGALPEQLMESELFGHERGAFSGADCARPGLFEMAHTGTLFLDEVAELEPRMQVKLLRVLDGVPYYRVGGQKKVQVNTRILAATNQNLEEAVRTGRFRSDLYHRLNQFQVRVPPLRERREDIVALAEHFLRQHSDEAVFDEAAKTELRKYAWPGNVRELRNLMERVALFLAAEPLQALTPAFVQSVAPELKAVHHQAAVESVADVLARFGGRHDEAARHLGISRTTLWRRLRAE